MLTGSSRRDMTLGARPGLSAAQHSLLAPSVTALVFVFLLTLAFALGFSWPSTKDPDIWWHLKTGGWIIGHGAVPWTDPFGANTEGVRWIAYSWLPEVLFHLADKADPVAGLRYIPAVVLAATAAVLYIHARATSGSARLAAILVTLFLIPVVPWAVRPQIFSFLFMAATMLCLWWGSERHRKAWWLLPPLFFIWANVHIYFIVGLGLVTLITLVRWLAQRFGPQQGERPPLPGMLALSLCFLAPLLNPYGYALYGEALQLAIHGAQEWPAKSIRELASPNFHYWPAKVFLAWVVSAVLVFICSDKRPSALTGILFAGLLYQALQHIRDMAYFIIIMLPIMAAHLAHVRSGAVQRLLVREPATPLFTKLPAARAALHWLLALAAGLVVISAGMALRANTEELLRHRDDVYPAGAVEFLLKHRPPAPLYNSLDWGGYLINRLSPAYQVYIDNRTQLYSNAFWETHDQVRLGKSRWSENLAASGAQAVLWAQDTPLASLLRVDPDWQLVYEDETAVVFVRKSIPR